MTTLVLLPGMDGTGELFAPFQAALTNVETIKIVSYPTTQALDYPQLEILVRAALPSNEPYVRLAESFFGPIAIALAASNPGQLKGLILCCTFARCPYELPTGLRSIITVPMVKMFPMGLLRWPLMGSFSTVALKAMFTRALAKVTPDVLCARLSAVLSVDVLSELENITVPVLYLRATQDRIIPRSVLRAIKEFVMNIRLIDINAPHFLLQTVSDQAAQAVTAFLREIEVW